MLTFTQQLRNKVLFEQAKLRDVTATVNGTAKRPKWAFNVLAVAGNKVEVFQDYTFASKWITAQGGGVVYPRDLVADYTSCSVMLKDGLTLHDPAADLPIGTQLDMFATDGP